MAAAVDQLAYRPALWLQISGYLFQHDAQHHVKRNHGADGHQARRDRDDVDAPHPHAAHHVVGQAGGVAVGDQVQDDPQGEQCQHEVLHEFPQRRGVGSFLFFEGPIIRKHRLKVVQAWDHQRIQYA